MKPIKLLFFLLLFFLVGCQKPVTIEVEKNEKTNIPTVFIHGYSGSQRTMKPMITVLEKADVTKNEMEMTVFEDGKLEVTTELKDTFQGNNPSINLIFDNNKSSQWHQAEWIKIALSYLKSEFKVEKVNIVGFSMGGISSFLYMETFSKEITQPKVEKLIAIGAPFNEFIEDNTQTEDSLLSDGPKQKSEQLINYENLLPGLPTESSYFLIGGQLSDSDLSDGTVPLNSSIGIFSLLKENSLSVKYHIITGNEGKHSKLKKNTEVIKLVGEYLFEN